MKFRGVLLASAFALLLGVLAEAGTAFAQGEQIKGRIIGETCAKKGKVGECYLKWAHPMVLWTEDGSYYRINLLGEGLDQASLDRAFGNEVVMEGWITGTTIKVTKLTVIGAGGKKEFFKG
jgi:hypothetical protein